LLKAWPNTISFPGLLRAVSAGAGADHGDKIPHVLAEILFEAYRTGIIELHKVPLRCANVPSERPTVWSFARRQAQRRQDVTTMRFENLRVDDDAGRAFIVALDGSRDRAALAKFIGSLPGPQRPAGHLEERLEELAKLGLLES
jgi:hypothetical protein